MDPQFIKSVADNWPWLIVAVVIVWPVVHFLYNRQITLLKEDIDRLKSRVEERAQSSSDVEAYTVAALPPASSVPSSTASHLRDPDRFAEYPDWLKTIPPVPPENRTILPASAAQEISRAYLALPPLDRKKGIRDAYQGMWMEGEGTIRSIGTSLELFQVRVSDRGGISFVLTYAPSQRAAVASFREGQTVHFKGQIHDASDGSVELIYVTAK